MAFAASRPAEIAAGNESLHGELVIPEEACGVVVFAQGTGSSCSSMRSRFLATQFHANGMGTLRVDLLTKEEIIDCRHPELRFDMPLLTERLLSVLEWLQSQTDVGNIPVGFLGTTTGAAASLIAASQCDGVAAVVSFSGRLDYADDILPEVSVPTLLVVGDEDTHVLQANRIGFEELAGVKRLVILPGASHHFEEPGMLEHLAMLSSEWFRQHLGAADKELKLQFQPRLVVNGR